ncbi:Alpha-1,3/1,6-mannosyltransferase ALG2 [Clarias magur]|uniref:Alpha-1,3/1,6-mannosyltransferase ALG2 n=1 Tax=Clarias magur TaxID=1594786 RepID=A0A8J4XGD4_CLAMG|nr:Alpha-1,3/1,6-mannosyltransferase ALG2 [Clarias magur]
MGSAVGQCESGRTSSIREWRVSDSSGWLERSSADSWHMSAEQLVQGLLRE